MRQLLAESMVIAVSAAIIGIPWRTAPFER